jgi:hypothetical protein
MRPSHLLVKVINMSFQSIVDDVFNDFDVQGCLNRFYAKRLMTCFPDIISL